MKKLKKLIERTDFEWVKNDLLPLIGLLNVGNKISKDKDSRFFLFPLSKENIITNLKRITQYTKEQIILKLKEFEDIFKEYIKLKSKNFTYGNVSPIKHHSVPRKCVDLEDLDFTSEYYELKTELIKLSNKAIENLKFDVKEIIPNLTHNAHTLNHLILLVLFREIVRKLSYDTYYKLDTTKYGPNKADLRRILMKAQVDEAFINHCIIYINYREIFKLLSYNKKYFGIIFSHNFNTNTCYRSENLLIVKKVVEELKESLENYDFIKILKEKYEILKTELSCEKNRLPLFEYKDKLKFLVENNNYIKLLDPNSPLLIDNIDQHYKTYKWFESEGFFQIKNNSIILKTKMEENFKRIYSNMQVSEEARIKRNLEDLLNLWNDTDIEINNEMKLNRHKGAGVEAANKLIVEFELKIRELIKDQLEKSYGEDWWTQGVPSNIREMAEKRKLNKEKIEPRRIYKVIDFLNFLDYSNIMLYKKNWNDIFKEFFREKYVVQAPFEKLSNIRNDLAHNRFMEEDFKRCKTYIEDILKYLPEY